MVTPFGADYEIDYDVMRSQIEFQVHHGADGLLQCGTTGEAPTLTWEDHAQVIEVTLRGLDGRVGLLTGTGSNRTADAIEATEQARSAGVSAALLVDCYYNAPSSLELRMNYYERVLTEVSDIPIVPYIIPSRSGCTLEAADLATLHLNDPKRVPAVKQATGDLKRMRQDRAYAGSALSIMSGDDEITLKMMRDDEVRCPGVISVMSNIAPAAIGAMVRAQAAGDVEEADRLQHALAPILGLVGCSVTSRRTLPNGQDAEVLDKFRNPVPVKTMMAGLGMGASHMRLPLGQMTAEAVARCRDALRKVYERDRSILEPIEEAFDVRIDQRLADDAAWSVLVR